jgi:integral membrane sensor domain MASE1
MDIKSGSDTTATLFFPAAGVTIAFLLYFGLWIIPLIPINIIFSALEFNRPFFVLLFAPLIITIGYGGTGYILKLLKFNNKLNSLKDSISFLGVTSGGALFVGYTYGLVLMYYQNWDIQKFILFGIDWGIGDLVGIHSITPFLLVILFPLISRITENNFDFKKINSDSLIKNLKAFSFIIIVISIYIFSLFFQPIFLPTNLIFLFFIPLTIIAIVIGLKSNKYF